LLFVRIPSQFSSSVEGGYDATLPTYPYILGPFMDLHASSLRSSKYLLWESETEPLEVDEVSAKGTLDDTKFIYIPSTWLKSHSTFDLEPIPFCGECPGLALEFNTIPSCIGLYSLFWPIDLLKDLPENKLLWWLFG
jgi:hypothetical protein